MAVPAYWAIKVAAVRSSAGMRKVVHLHLAGCDELGQQGRAVRRGGQEVHGFRDDGAGGVKPAGEFGQTAGHGIVRRGLWR